MDSFNTKNEFWNKLKNDGWEGSKASAEGMETVVADQTSEPIVKQISDLAYAEYDNYTPKMQLLLPDPSFEGEKRPVLMFIRGSAWRKQSVVAGMPQLVGMAKRGFIVASVEYRPSTVAHFPAQVEDCRKAIAFLAAHADEMCADMERFAVWGSSSGSHTAMMLALTDIGVDAPRPKAVIDYYGPCYVPDMVDVHEGVNETIELLLGGPYESRKELALAASPWCHIEKGQDIPPFLIMHGNMDRSCMFEQSVKLYEKLKEVGADVRFIRMLNAPHGGAAFWTNAAFDILEGFLREKM